MATTKVQKTQAQIDAERKALQAAKTTTPTKTVTAQPVTPAPVPTAQPKQYTAAAQAEIAIRQAEAQRTEGQKYQQGQIAQQGAQQRIDYIQSLNKVSQETGIENLEQLKQAKPEVFAQREQQLAQQAQAQTTLGGVVRPAEIQAKAGVSPTTAQAPKMEEVSIATPQGTAYKTKIDTTQLDAFSFNEGGYARDDRGGIVRVAKPYTIDKEGRRRDEMGREVSPEGLPYASPENNQLETDFNKKKKEEDQKKKIDAGILPPSIFTDEFKTQFTTQPTQAVDTLINSLAKEAGINVQDAGLQQALSNFKQQVAQGYYPTNDPEKAAQDVKRIIDQYKEQTEAKEKGVTIPSEPMFVVDEQAIIDSFNKEKERITAQQENKKTQIGTVMNADGSGSYQSGSVTVPLKGNDIDWNNISEADIYNMSPEDFMKWTYISDVKLNEDNTNKIIVMLDGQKKDYLAYRDDISALLSKYEENAISRRTSEQAKIEQEALYNKSLLELAKSKTEQELNAARSRSTAYLSARLHAMGADDSINGIQRMVFEETEWAKKINDAGERYNIEISNLSQKLLQTKDDFVNDINDIQLNTLTKKIENNKDFTDKITEIEKSKLLTEIEKDKSKADLRKDLFKNLMSLDQQRKQDAIEREKLMYQKAKDLQKESTEKTGYAYSIDENNNVVLDLDPNGDPIKTWDRQKEEMKMLETRSEIDSAVSGKLGFLVNKFGEALTDADGKRIEIPKEKKYLHWTTSDDGSVYGITEDGIETFGRIGKVTKQAAGKVDYFANLMGESSGAVAEYSSENIMDGSRIGGLQKDPTSLFDIPLESVVSRITTEYGGSTVSPNNPLGGEAFHKGYDVIFPSGKVKSLTDGMIVGINRNNGAYGVSAYILDTKGNIWQYSHLDPNSEILLNQSIPAGTAFATMGTSGNVFSNVGKSGAHTDIRLVNQKSPDAVVNTYADMIEKGTMGLSNVPTGNNLQLAVRTLLDQRGFKEPEKLLSDREIQIKKEMGETLTPQEEAALRVIESGKIDKKQEASSKFYSNIITSDTDLKSLKDQLLDEEIDINTIRGKSQLRDLIKENYDVELNEDDLNNLSSKMKQVEGSGYFDFLFE